MYNIISTLIPLEIFFHLDAYKTLETQHFFLKNEHFCANDGRDDYHDLITSVETNHQTFANRNNKPIELCVFEINIPFFVVRLGRSKKNNNK